MHYVKMALQEFARDTAVIHTKCTSASESMKKPHPVLRSASRDRMRGFSEIMGDKKAKKRECKLKNRIKNETQVINAYLNSQGCGSSPRAISIAQLHTLLCFHLRPIKLVVCKCPYSLEGMGYLISRCASRLDAFSVYHIRTRLLCYALGRTTDAPEVRPTRSSRTKVSSSQISNAHDR